MDLAPSEPCIWLIAGPTASGKSALALRLAREIGAEIVNADSMQLYADLRILTARPSADEEAQAPHHLFGVADPAEAWSVGRWVRAAENRLGEIAARGRPAIVVGGTGLYFRALTQGLSAIPPVPATVRTEIATLWLDLGETGFRARLAAVDPRSAARIAPGDRQRLTRALEVAIATGVPIGAFRGADAPALKPGSWRGVVLDPPREILSARCEARLAAMARTGALGEVSALVARGLAPDLPAMKALGIREFAAHLAGTVSLDEALAQVATATRRYVKRQSTWFRHQTPDWPRLAGEDDEALWRRLLAIRPSLTPGGENAII